MGGRILTICCHDRISLLGNNHLAMTSRTRRSISTLATQTQGSQGNIPRTMPVRLGHSMPFNSAALADEMTHGNFSLTSSALGSRRTHSSRSAAFSSGSYADDDEYLLSASAGMSYPSMSISDSPFAVPVMGYDADLTSEFLTEDAFSSNSSAEMTFVSPHYPGQGNPQEHLHSDYLPMESSMYMPGMMPNFNAADCSRYPTPPPEEENDYFLQSVHGYQEQSCPMDKDFAMSNGFDTCFPSPDRSDTSSFPSHSFH